MFRAAFARNLRTGARFSTRAARRSSVTPARVALAAGFATALVFPWTHTSNDADADKISKELEGAGLTEKPSDYEVLQQSESVKSASSDKGLEAEKPEQPEQPEQEEGQAAYNPETGEINWDCPCLGGMAHGPCGEEFKEAFSCFVYSETEPKGMDCIKKFEAMRTCFKQHPEHYKEELYEDDELEAQPDVPETQLQQEVQTESH